MTLNLALDYDQTYTYDPEFWDKFIDLAHQHKHRVYIVTMRFEKQAHDMERIINKIGLENIYFTGQSMKKSYMEEKSIHIDIWIDDQPVFIG